MDWFALFFPLVLGSLPLYDAQTSPNGQTDITTSSQMSLQTGQTGQTSPNGQTGITNSSQMSLQTGQTGCAGPPVLCCPGRNDNCTRGGCFCDDHCLIADDCCADRRSACITPSINTTSEGPILTTGTTLTETSTTAYTSSGTSSPADGSNPTETTTSNKDVNVVTFHLRVSVKTNMKNVDLLVAVSNFVSQTLGQQICEGCTTTIRHIKPT